MKPIKVELPSELKEVELYVFSDLHIGDVGKLFANTSAMLEYGGYGARQSYTPSSTDCPIIYLGGHKKKAWAVL